MENKQQTQGQTLSPIFLFLAITFVVCLIVSNIFVPRTWQLWGGFQLTAGVLIFPISYIINDCLTEVYGYRKARMVIWMAFAMSVFVALMSFLAVRLPMPPEADGRAAENAGHFNVLFDNIPRVTIASLLAFVCGSMANSWVMSKMKVATAGKGFFARAIISSLVGESIDSVIFFPIAMFGIMNWYDVLMIMITQVIVKTVYEIIILPVTALVVKQLKKKEGLDTFDTKSEYLPLWMRRLKGQEE